MSYKQTKNIYSYIGIKLVSWLVIVTFLLNAVFTDLSYAIDNLRKVRLAEQRSSPANEKLKELNLAFEIPAAPTGALPLFFNPQRITQDLEHSLYTSPLTEADETKIAALNVPKYPQYLFDFPLKMLADSDVDISTDDLLIERLSQLRVYPLISFNHQKKVHQTAKSLIPLIPHIIKYSKQILGYEPLNISFFGSYIWNPKPEDLDILIVVKGKVLTTIDIKDLSALVAKGDALEKEVTKVSLHIVGQDALENNVDPEIPEGAIFADPKLMINSLRTRTNRVQLVL